MQQVDPCTLIDILNVPLPNAMQVVITSDHAKSTWAWTYARLHYASPCTSECYGCFMENRRPTPRRTLCNTRASVSQRVNVHVFSCGRASDSAHMVNGGLFSWCSLVPVQSSVPPTNGTHTSTRIMFRPRLRNTKLLRRTLHIKVDS